MSDAPGTSPWLRPWRVERILLRDSAAAPGLLVVDKPSGIAVHGGREELGDDVVGRLRELLQDESGEPPYLGVHQRLDQGTSGALLFTTSPEANAGVAEAKEEHQLRRTYVAVVRVADGSRSQQDGRRQRSTPVTVGLRDQGELSHRLEHQRGITRVVSRGGQQAFTEYRVLRRTDDRALVELRPRTGRTHQLRVQLAEVGAPIVGDPIYGGEPAPRLFLHSKRLEGGPLPEAVEAPVPACFGEWLEHGALRAPTALRGALDDAACRRYALRHRTTTYRLVNSSADQLPGLTIDLYGCAPEPGDPELAGAAGGVWAAVSIYESDWYSRLDELGEALLGMGLSGAYLKTRVRADLRRQSAEELAPDRPFAGTAAPEKFCVEEGSLRLSIELGEGLSTGLFVDQRDNRARAGGWSAGGRMLNLFCYTGSFGVAAALGGARETVSVDLSGRAIERTRRNYELNGLALGDHQFIKEDAVKWLRRAARRVEPAERFRFVVLDPPSFATVGGGTFRVEKDYVEVAALSLALLEPGGRLLAVTNHTKTSPNAFRRMLHEAARRAGREVQSLKDMPSGLDCQGWYAYPKHPRDAVASLTPWPSKSCLLTVT